MIPYTVTIEAAAAPLASLTFLFYGAGLFVFPVVLAYTIAVYSIFKGKVHEGYDDAERRPARRFGPGKTEWTWGAGRGHHRGR